MRLLSSVITLTIASSLTACVSTAVKQENRDQTGKFDGQWTLNYVMHKTEQRIGHVLYTCSGDKGTLNIKINNGEVTGDLQSEQPTYVDANGHIYFVSSHSEEGFSLDTPASDAPGSRILMNIDLSETAGTGKMIFAMGTGNAGCPGTLTLTKHGN
ncbi:hypothetical protein QCD60_06740 [Pokkaliibacter sp. MBI-7]|uniref:hypothetical protein n=1 Tax=Pokkaliibacter sp. MBI-7 TaxID=3040600 RepID=UPI00244A2467|nr:hypothetical protein [Pokkaliibacter sp. MBI-7]MDH2432255.1 hypothetical protein [Pokkaliibacter sp. MBI-7]